MSGNASEGATEAPAVGTTTDLTERLGALGLALPESHRPVPHQVPDILSGLIYWLETGSLEPPVYETDNPQPVTNIDAENAELRARIAAMEAQQKPASPVTAAVPVPDTTPAQSPAATTPPEPEATPTDAGQPPAPSTSDVPSTPAS